MKGLFIWAHSHCRSTLAFYRGLGLAFEVPVKIVFFVKTCDNRKIVGFSDTEFSDLDLSFLRDYENPKKIIDDYCHWNHLFGVYQQNNGSRELIHYAKQKGCRVAIISEAPCNMDSFPRRLLKELYLKFLLPIKVKQTIRDVDFMINLSGNNYSSLTKIGWPVHKIIPCGYYSPALIGSKPVLRDENSWNNFTILLSGLHQWHRSPILLLKALRELDNRGIPYKCIITQEGPLWEKMKRFAEGDHLKNVKFLGFIPMEELIKVYETCSVYVGAGDHEPWGMRLNDALQCGSPMIINRGMGGYKMVEDYQCGLTFNKGNYLALADSLEKMIKDKEYYLTVAERAFKASKLVDPLLKSAEMAQVIKSRFPSWLS